MSGFSVPEAAITTRKFPSAHDNGYLAIDAPSLWMLMEAAQTRIVTSSRNCATNSLHIRVKNLIERNKHNKAGIDAPLNAPALDGKSVCEPILRRKQK
jgi:hypothetical protein